MLNVLLPILGSIGQTVAQSLFPNPEQADKRLETQQKFLSELIQSSDKLQLAAADIIKAEAQSESWLTANWRPLTMLFFVTLIGARWFGYTAPGMTQEEYLAIYELVKLGLTGYVIGRSAEKIGPDLIKALKNK